MPRIVLAQLRHRAGRAVALLVGVLVATTGFTLLTGQTSTARLDVVGTVDANARGAYDILVRPNGSRTTREGQQGLVRSNSLSSQFGGITMKQYERLKQIPGVDVAAPVANIGHARAGGFVEVDVTNAVDRSLERQVLRVSPTWSAARGLTALDDDTPQYVYVTRRPVVWADYDETGVLRFSDGRTRPEPSKICDGGLFALEIQDDGRELPLCASGLEAQRGPLGNEEARATLRVVRLRPDGTFGIGYRPDTGREQTTARLTVPQYWPLSLPLAAVDPEAEAELVGLEEAVTSGRYLSADDRAREQGPSGGQDTTSVPVLMSATTFLDEGLSVTTDRVSGAAVDRLPGMKWEQSQQALGAAGGVPAGVGGTYTAADAYSNLLRGADEVGNPVADMVPVVQAGDPRYKLTPDGTLTPQRVANDASVFVEDRFRGNPTSWLLADSGFRPLRQAPTDEQNYVLAESVGVFDPHQIDGFSELSAVPLETYFPPEATGADDRSRKLLGGQPLRPDSNPAGYLASPPLMLTSLEAYPGLTDSPAPLSTIRVRVSGVTGFDDVSRERVRAVADQIVAETGLDVDVALGSSPAPQTIALPAGDHGRPELLLEEQWSKKGVAAVIVEAVDRKSIVLFGLILVVCLVFLGNAVSAAVRDRRRELAVLACLGWSRVRLAGLITGEVAVVGLAAGVMSAALALPLAHLADIRLSPLHSLLPIPVAVLLALLAATVPAWQAARSHPAAAVYAAARPPGRRRGHRRRTVAGLAAANLGRVPGRTALGVVALGIGVGGLTVLAAVNRTFHGSVTGSLLGDAVSLQVRGVDAVAVAVTILLGAVVIADVLYLNVRDRSPELAALRATGWSPAATGRLIAYEGVAIGLVGSVLGAAAGLGATAAFAGGVTTGLVWMAVTASAAGVALAALAATVPALLQRRIPISTLLGEE